MPCESTGHEDEYLDKLGKIKCILLDLKCTCVIIIGDWNANIHGSTFGDHLANFIEEENLEFSSKLMLPANTFSFISEAWNTTSWLDHCVSTSDGNSIIKSMEIDYDGAVGDHFPMYVNISSCNIPVLSDQDNEIHNGFKWKNVTSKQVTYYSDNTERLLSEINIPTEALSCKDMNCSEHEHSEAIESFYNDIVDALKSSDSVFLGRKPKFKARPGWNEYASDLYDSSRQCLKMWIDAGKPKHGHIFNLMSHSRARFKYANRKIKRNEGQLRSDKLGLALAEKAPQEFFKEVRKIKCSKTPLPTSIDGISGEAEILSMWKSHYLELFNCLKSTSSTKNIQYSAEYTNDLVVQSDEIIKIINGLDSNKSCGLDGIYAEHLKHASCRIGTLLALCFSSCFIHGFLPENLMSVILVPIIKDKAGKINRKKNYRPIALASIISKVLELVILDRISLFLSTNDNQFGFKKKLGTDTCIYVLKEVIDRYRSLNGSVFTCFLDASKAFDRINHRKLFCKLLERGVPGYIVRILSFWYANQCMRVRWGAGVSGSFTVSNGVRQGGILSPYLFNVFMDDLSDSLNKYPAGCFLGKILINHLMYADDLVLLCPSAHGLRLLLKLCEKFGMKNDVDFNYEKSVIMIHRTKEMRDVDFGSFYINGDRIAYKDRMR